MKVFYEEKIIIAFLLAMSMLTTSLADTVPEFTCVHKMVQFRRHDRALIKSQRERTYKLNCETVAKNCKPRFEQKGPALSDWYEEQVKCHGRQEADRMRSQLTVEKSTRRNKNENNENQETDKVWRGLCGLFMQSMCKKRR